jgi:hypothetical protein
MATVTGPRAAADFPVPGITAMQGAQGVSWGYYNHASNLAAATIIEYCKVPAGATVIGGYFQADDLDTGIEELDIDIGWSDNGPDAVDVDGFGNLAVLTGDVSVHLPVAGIWVPFNGIIQTAGFKTFAANTTLIATINVDAATGGTGISKMVAWWVGGGIATP